MDTFFHSVHLEPELCKGCINCLKRCPTQAIRVRNGKASIIKEFCIDCGECIRICPHHAKKATYDPLDILDKFEYKVALPPPSLYAQFNNLEDKGLVLEALLKLGFDDVYEVAAAAEMVSEITRDLIRSKKVKLPLISSACPSVVRLIRVRFPNLIDSVSPLNAPVELAAEMAMKRAIQKTGLPREKIGIIFITPCPAKMTAINVPLGKEKSQVDGVVAMSEVYQRLLPLMKEIYEANPDGYCSQNIDSAGKIGVSWGKSGGEAGGLLIDQYLAADGIENVIRVLEDLEDDKLHNLTFIELNACSGGCVGGVLAVENPYIARVKINTLRKYLPISCSHLNDNYPENAFLDEKIQFMPVYKLGSDIAESIELMAKADEILERLPGLDCGCCGAPTCKALAEDVVRGNASEKDCIHILKEYIHKLSDEMSKLG